MAYIVLAALCWYFFVILSHMYVIHSECILFKAKTSKLSKRGTTLNLTNVIHTSGISESVLVSCGGNST